MSEENEHLKQMLDKRDEYIENQELILTVKKLNDELNKLRKSELHLKLQVNELLSKRKIKRAKIKDSWEKCQKSPLLDFKHEHCRTE